MSRRKYSVQAEKTYLLRQSVLTKLLSLTEPEAAKLYLLILSLDGEFETEDLAALMELSLAKTEKLLDSMEVAGVFSDFSAVQNTALTQGIAFAQGDPSEVLPVRQAEVLYTQSDITAVLESDEAFKGIASFSEKKLGRVLGSQDLMALMRIYRHIGFSAETICLLVSHSVELFETKYEGKRRPTFRHIEKEAILWDKEGIDTPQKADRYIKDYKERNKTVASFLELFDYRGELSPSIEKYVLSWEAFCFSKQMLLHAFDITVLKCGKLEFKYLNSILCNWHKDGITCPEDLEKPVQKTSKPAASGPGTFKRQPSAKQISPPGADELASVQRNIEKRRARNV